MTRRHGPLGLVAAIIPWVMLVSASVGCEDKRLNLRNIEGMAAERFSERAGVPVTEVTCPKNVRTKKGDTFECTVAFEGGFELTLLVEQLGGGKTSWRPKDKRIVYAKELESLIQTRLSEQGKTTTVKCDQRIYALAPTDTITCQVFESGGSVRFMEISYTSDGEPIMRHIPPPMQFPDRTAAAERDACARELPLVTRRTQHETDCTCYLYRDHGAVWMRRRGRHETPHDRRRGCDG